MAFFAAALTVSLLSGQCSALPRTPTSDARNITTTATAVANVSFAAPTGAASKAREELAPKVIPDIWSSHMSTPEKDAPVTLTFVLKGKDYPGLTARMESIAASKAEWLTEEELAGYVGPLAGARSAVDLALKQMDATMVSVSPFGDKVTVNATVASIAQYFSAEFFKFQFPGQEPVYRTMNYTIPATVAPFVTDVYPISTFGVVAPVKLVVNNATTSAAAHMQERSMLNNPVARSPSTCSTQVTTPACYRSLYGFDKYQPPSGSSATPAVGILGYIGQSFNQADLKSYLTRFRPDAANYQINVQQSDGAQNNPSDPGIEAALDTQTVAAITYPLPSTFYDIGPSNPQGDIFLLTFQRFIQMKTRPSVLSISYGSDEVYFSNSQATTMCNAAQQLAAMGVTIVMSSGDSGVDGQGDQPVPPFRPTYPSGCPYVLSVGATQNFGPEAMVDTSLAGFYSGSGFSNIFSRPKYQDSQVQTYINNLHGLDNGYYNKNGRAFPDISAQGSRQPVVVSGTTYLVGGTSASAPIVAGGIALLNDLLTRARKPTVGWANPTFYANAGAFADVASGGSYAKTSNGQNVGFPAGKGWDVAAGQGTPVLSTLRSVYRV